MIQKVLGHKSFVQNIKEASNHLNHFKSSFTLSQSQKQIILTLFIYTFLREYSFWLILVLFLKIRNDIVAGLTVILSFTNTYSAAFLTCAILIQQYDSYQFFSHKMVENYFKIKLNEYKEWNKLSQKSQKTEIQSIKAKTKPQQKQVGIQFPFIIQIQQFWRKIISFNEFQFKTVDQLKELVTYKIGGPPSQILLVSKFGRKYTDADIKEGIITRLYVLLNWRTTGG